MSERDILARLSSLIGQRDKLRPGDIQARLAELPIKRDEQEGRELREALEKLLSEMPDPEALAFEIELDALEARLGGWLGKGISADVAELEAETYRLQAALHGLQMLSSLYLWYRLKGWPTGILQAELAAGLIREPAQEPGFSQDMRPGDREAYQALLEQFAELMGEWPAEPEAMDEAAVSDPLALRRQLAAGHFMRALEHLYWLRPADKQGQE